MQFKKATDFKTMQALEQEAISPLAGNWLKGTVDRQQFVMS
jgi:hypothetical protein